MHLIWTVLVGFVIGIIAKFIHPGEENFGFVKTVLLGIVGSLAAGYVGQLLGLYAVGQPAGFIASVVGAVALLYAYTAIMQRRAGS